MKPIFQNCAHWFSRKGRGWALLGLVILAVVAWAIMLIPPAKAQAVAQPVSSGFRAEVRAGLDHVSYASEVPLLNEGKSGVLFGVGVGYDWKLGSRFLSGLEIGIDAIDTSKCTQVRGNALACAKSRRDIEAGGRVGFLALPNVVVYAKAAYVSGRVNVKYQDFAVPQRSFAETTSGDGVRFGAGVELLFNREYYAKVEYRYSNYEEGFTRNQAIFGLGMRF